MRAWEECTETGRRNNSWNSRCFSRCYDSLAQSRPFDLLVSVIWSTCHSPERLTFCFQVPQGQLPRSLQHVCCFRKVFWRLLEAWCRGRSFLVCPLSPPKKSRRGCIFIVYVFRLRGAGVIILTVSGGNQSHEKGCFPFAQRAGVTLIMIK